MRKTLIMLAISLIAARPAPGEEPEQQPEATEPPPEAVAADGEETKTLAGMSILGNEEAPKSLVIIPWKSSEIGTDLGLSDNLDDRARPVDKDVFLRELAFYEIRAGE